MTPTSNPPTSVLNAAREILPIKDVASQLRKWSVMPDDWPTRDGVSLQKVFALMADSVDGHVAKHSQPYAGAGESELMEVVNAALSRGLFDSTTQSDIKWLIELPMTDAEHVIFRAALTPRVASVGEADCAAVLEARITILVGQRDQAMRAEQDCRQIIDTYVTETNCQDKLISNLREDCGKRDATITALRSQLSDAQREVVRLEQIVSGSIRP